MTYQEALTYLNSMINYEEKTGFDYKNSFKLEKMKQFSSLLGDPHRCIKAVHIGGTKGKGSVSSFINSILMEAGYKVGLYTSPHLFSFRERIRVNGQPISKEGIISLVGEIKPHVDAMKRKGEGPTYFEACTLMAFQYFKREKVDFMVLEVGMGGRLDSTNIVEPLMSVITPISYDHTRCLGSTLREIAFEKCGIIKNDSIVISSLQEAEAMDVIEDAARKKNSALYVVGRDVFFEAMDSDLEGQAFRLLTRYSEHPCLKIKLLGDFQIENAAAAVTAAEELRSRGIFISSAAIKDGLLKARWPGRLEIIHRKPFIVVDGAQNSDSISRLRKAIKNIFTYKRLLLIFGAMSDKDIDGMCRNLGGMADYAAVTKSKSERACPPQDIRNKILSYNKNLDVIATGSVGEAVRKCMENAGENDLILVTGSLYIAAEAMKKILSTGTQDEERH